MTWRWLWRVAVAAPLAIALATGVSVARTEVLQRSFDRQFWQDARYPTAELLGAWEAVGKVVVDAHSHCDFAAEAVYGTSDEYEPVEAYFEGRVVTVNRGTPVAFDVQPVSDEALAARPQRTGDLDAAVRETLIRTGVDMLRAQSFHTVYIVRAVSWGHAPWLDWRCY